MKKKIFKTLILIAFIIGNSFHSNAQDTNVTLVVTKTNGQEQTFQLGENSQLYFENGERLVIEDNANNTVTFLLSEIQKMVCTEYTGVDGNTVSGLWMAPNPTRNSFLIHNLQYSGPARIYALDGRLVKSFTATESQVVDVSDLATGMYLLHVDGQTLKMMKL